MDLFPTLQEKSQAGVKKCLQTYVVAENNMLGEIAGSGISFWLGETSDNTAEDKAKLAGGIAKAMQLFLQKWSGRAD
ncbi:hypothetical protein F9C28_17940 [Shimwellia pseudoproteus]|uniref:hypothetical protein n=1 Tax=Shimwellia pseudoproteus TaxID=570012 RepID=UPI0018EC92EB|nr:hypothetical protein [Shimwellia pseudoproteus]MBJ3816737.1 hypothetical protein [Shimwellia pseudoproteus]